jgi:hypothetical protein
MNSGESDSNILKYVEEYLQPVSAGLGDFPLNYSGEGAGKEAVACMLRL